jgi:hypothetical protein
VNQIIDYLKSKIAEEEDMAKKAQALGTLLFISSKIKDRPPSKVDIEYQHSIEKGRQVIITITYDLSPGRSHRRAWITNNLPAETVNRWKDAQQALEQSQSQGGSAKCDLGKSKCDDDYIQRVIEARGQSCPNCEAWRILTHEFEYSRSSIEAGSPRIIEQCSECGDEAFDIYEAAEDRP